MVRGKATDKMGKKMKQLAWEQKRVLSNNSTSIIGPSIKVGNASA